MRIGCPMHAERAGRDVGGGPHRQRHLRDHGGMVGTRLQHARRDHVAVADRLDLFDAQPHGDRIEA